MVSGFYGANYGIKDNKILYAADSNLDKCFKKSVDVLRLFQNRALESMIQQEIRVLSNTIDPGDIGENDRELTYDPYNIVQSFNELLWIELLRFSNVLMYPNETYYGKVAANQTRIKPDLAMEIANELCDDL